MEIFAQCFVAVAEIVSDGIATTLGNSIASERGWRNKLLVLFITGILAVGFTAVCAAILVGLK